MQAEKQKLTFEKNSLETINKVYESELQNNKELKRNLKAKTEQKISESLAIFDIEKKSLDSQFMTQIKEKDNLITLMKNTKIKE